MTLLGSYKDKPAQITGYMKTLELFDGAFKVEFDAETRRVLTVTDRDGNPASARWWLVAQEELEDRYGFGGEENDFVSRR
jgi:hypothetical protein